MEPVEVNKPRGEFAKKLHGQVMPKGKGWKPVMDLDRKLQIMLPDKWKATVTRDAEAAIVAVPGGDKPAGCGVGLALTPLGATSMVVGAVMLLFTNSADLELTVIEDTKVGVGPDGLSVRF